MPLNEGGTIRDALISVWKQTGEKPKELAELPSFPEEIRFLFEVYSDLSNSRRYEQGVALPIPHSEILAWCQLNGFMLRPWEIKLLRTLDFEYCKAVNKRVSS